MGKLFSKSSQKLTVSRVTEQDKAVLQLKTQRDNLKLYQKKIELNLERERNIAKRLLKDGKKEKALSLLKKKRFQEQLISRTTNQLDNIERMVHDLEFAQVEMQVLDGLKVGNESLKKMQQMLSLEDVEQIMDETKEAVEYQQEIDRLISGSLNEVDMTEIESELNQILGGLEEAEEELPELPEVEKEEMPIPELPEVPEELPARPAKAKTKEKLPAEPMLA